MATRGPTRERKYKEECNKIFSLIEKSMLGDEVDFSDESFALEVSCEYGHLKYVKHLVEEVDVSVDTKNDEEMTPLMVASELGYTEIVKFLLESGASTEDTNEDGETALSIASGLGHLEIVKILVEHNADIDHEDEIGFTPFSVALGEEKMDVAKYLAMKGANLDHEYLNEGCTLLSYQILHGRNDLAKFLIEHGADPDVTNGNGSNALSEAITQENEEMARYLVDAGANPFSEDEFGDILINKITEKFGSEFGIHCAGKISIENVKKVRKLLKGAIKTKDLKLIKIIVDQCPNLKNDNDSKNDSNNGVKSEIDSDADSNNDIDSDADSDTDSGEILTSDLLLQAVEVGDMDIVGYLLEKGIPIKDGALTKAVDDEKYDLAKVLIENKADINENGSEGTPLMMAVSKGNLDFVNYLLEHGADVNAQSCRGNTALYYALMRSPKLLKHLLEKGADVNIKDGYESTVLQKVASMAKLEDVMLLVEHGADLNSKNVFGCTTLECFKDEQIKEYLKSKGAK